ncbi:MAG TPA: glycosyltransferase family 4 protein [Candidatus Moranbacteria bacterium]|nr:glycosyltransferase family 4 protein [Candidatus Moranbacteria bacterium]
MRILFFNYEYPPLGGGAGNASAYLLGEYAKREDLEVDFVTSSIDGEYHLEKLGERIRVHRLPIGKNKDNLHFQSQKDLLRYSYRALKFAWRLAKKNKYDVGHAFFGVPCGFLAMLIKWRFGIPYIVSLRGADVPGYSERFPLWYVLLGPVVKLVWKNAKHVVANSQGLKELALKTLARQEIAVIPNGIATEEFFPGSRTGTEDTFEIICVSRITPRKGIRFLVMAMEGLVEKYPHMRLTVIGEGNEKKSLENLVRSLHLERHVRFLGLISHARLPQYYREADVFVLPSLNEGMSNTVLEALASGLPIVATRTGGTEELVSDGVNGFVVEMRSSEDIAKSLEDLAQHPVKRLQMAAMSRQIAKRMSWESVAAKYEKAYRFFA